MTCSTKCGIQGINFLCSNHTELQQVCAKAWAEAEELCIFLQPFAAVTSFMSSEKYPTLSSVVPLFNLLVDKLEDTVSNRSASDFIKRGAEACKEKLLKYYRKTGWKECTVTVLDPRFNLKYFKDNGWERSVLDEVQKK